MGWMGAGALVVWASTAWSSRKGGLGAMKYMYAVGKELWYFMPYQTISSQIKVTYNIKFSNRIRIVGERLQQEDNLLHKIYCIIYDVRHGIMII